MSDLIYKKHPIGAFLLRLFYHYCGLEALKIIIRQGVQYEIFIFDIDVHCFNAN